MHVLWKRSWQHSKRLLHTIIIFFLRSINLVKFFSKNQKNQISFIFIFYVKNYQWNNIVCIKYLLLKVICTCVFCICMYLHVNKLSENCWLLIYRFRMVFLSPYPPSAYMPSTWLHALSSLFIFSFQNISNDLILDFSLLRGLFLLI